MHRMAAELPASRRAVMGAWVRGGVNSLSITSGCSGLADSVGEVCVVAGRDGSQMVWRLEWRLVGG
jgi:hypothetical protein